ncbi:hypothetical protein SVIOM342S_08446 [Streptomyces violaceorubidus]
MRRVRGQVDGQRAVAGAGRAQEPGVARGRVAWPGADPASAYARAWNSRTTSMRPTMCRLNSVSSSAGTHSSRMVSPPARRTGYRARKAVSASKRVT